VLPLLIGVGVMTLQTRTWSYGILMTSFGFTWLALFYLCVLLLAVTQPQSWLGACLRFGPLRRLGGIAYGVYLLHQIFWLGIRLTQPTWTVLRISLTGLVLTLVLAALSSRYFEKPLIDLGHRLSALPDEDVAARQPESLPSPTS
jgi:peptidoglycan/LPS O-acetylase OafA/YrhL